MPLINSIPRWLRRQQFPPPCPPQSFLLNRRRVAWLPGWQRDGGQRCGLGDVAGVRLAMLRRCRAALIHREHLREGAPRQPWEVWLGQMHRIVYLARGDEAARRRAPPNRSPATPLDEQYPGRTSRLTCSATVSPNSAASPPPAASTAAMAAGLWQQERWGAGDGSGGSSGGTGVALGGLRHKSNHSPQAAEAIQAALGPRESLGCNFATRVSPVPRLRRCPAPLQLL